MRRENPVLHNVLAVAYVDCPNKYMKVFGHLHWIIQDCIYFGWGDAKLVLQLVRVEPGIEISKRCELSFLGPYFFVAQHRTLVVKVDGDREVKNLSTEVLEA